MDYEEKIQNAPFWVLAYYLFTEIKNPHEEVVAHKKFFKDRNITSRIYISENGINGQMSGAREDAKDYIEWIKQLPEFAGIKFKIHPHHENVFPRATVKYRKQLVAIDKNVDLSLKGEHVSPKTWKEMLDDKETNKILVDVRNEYEWRVGHFSGADLPPCENFREFSEYADKLKEKADPKTTPVMMYCTGGIRCELYSSLLKEKGFDKVYQLDGGVIGYGLQQGSAHWKGKLFVFDDRLAIPVSEEQPAPVVGTCHHCKTANENYYNCANMDCNNLILCCPTCLKENLGCCSAECMKAPRLRAYQSENTHKPFKRGLKRQIE